MKILLIDNYDSFTYNLAQYLGELGVDLRVVRNDEITLREVGALNPDGIVISPGPGVPANSGITIDLIRKYSANYPILGVCLGHQAICEAFGGRIERAPSLVHGKISHIDHQRQGVFKGLPSPFPAARYHSLVVDPTRLPECLEVTATCGGGIIMGVAHKTLPVYGVQFHPESFLTEGGMDLLQNFLNIVRENNRSKTN